LKPSRKTLPVFVTPMAAQAVSKLPEGDAWLYEAKLDGYRVLLLKNAKQIQLLSRNEKDLTRMYPTVAAAALHLKAEQATLDGEIVALAEDGRPSFQALQHSGAHPEHRIVFYVFDVLNLDGRDLMGQPLVQRRERLPRIVGEDSTIRLSRELPGSVSDIIQALRAAGIEGVVAKRKDSPYQPGERSSDWVKLKLDRQQEFVIGGYRPDGTIGLDALLVGYYEGNKLLFAGKVRAGLIAHARRELLGRLKPLHTSACPFANLPDAQPSRWGGGITAEQMPEMQWSKPLLVAQIRFVEWTAESRLRHAAFLGLRLDKSARDVQREASAS
jgi:bifunctional non-homologous end joining protein LigD